MAKGQKYSALHYRNTQLCTTDRKTSPAFSYARRQELIINRDVTCESRLWEKPMSHLDRSP